MNKFSNISDEDFFMITLNRKKDNLRIYFDLDNNMTKYPGFIERRFVKLFVKSFKTIY